MSHLSSPEATLPSHILSSPPYTTHHCTNDCSIVPSFAVAAKPYLTLTVHGHPCRACAEYRCLVELLELLMHQAGASSAPRVRLMHKVQGPDAKSTAELHSARPPVGPALSLTLRNSSPWKTVARTPSPLRTRALPVPYLHIVGAGERLVNK